MAEDRVTLTADGTQYFDVMRRAGAAADRLAGSGDRIGGGFIRGDRVARSAATNITGALLTANSAADALVISLQSLERVFRVSLGLTVVGAALIAAGAAISGMIDRAAKLNAEIAKLVSFGKGNADFLGTAEIQQNLDAVTTKIRDLQEGVIKRTAFLSQNLRQLAPLLNIFVGSGAAGAIAKGVNLFNQSDQDKIHQLQEQSAEDVFNLTSKQNDLNRVQLERLNGLNDIADLDEAEIKSKEKLGQLAQLAVNAGLAQTEAARQLLETEKDRFKIESSILEKKKEQAQTKSLNTVDDFLADLGSGRFAKNVAAQQQRNRETAQGQQILAEIQDAQKRGIGLGPIFQEAARVADRMATKTQTGLTTLVNADFSNLLLLSKYDFTGLAPLNNLTIQIQ